MNRSQLPGAMNNLTTHDLLSYKQKLSREENVAEVAQGVTRLLLEMLRTLNDWPGSMN